MQIYFFGIAKFSKLGMQNHFSGLQFPFFACNITFQTCGNDPPLFFSPELGESAQLSFALKISGEFLSIWAKFPQITKFFG
jgi:hypothetical protein